MQFHSAGFEAIGVANQVTVTDPAQLDAALAVARAQLDALDRACSRFRDDSEIAALDSAGRGGLAVSPLLLAATEVALEAARSTGGLVDPTVGRSLRGLGYDRDFDLVATGSAPAFRKVPASGWRSVRVERASRTIRLGRGAELDLGATAKAFAADRIARIVRAETGADVLVSLGGDIAVQGAPPAGWPIRVGEDHRAASGGQVVAIRGGALATSSTTVRRWKAGETTVHHIVDPRTGAPACEHWRTASVAAPTCVAANTASTAAIVLGPAAVEWLSERGLAARLVHRDGRIVTVGGWPAETLRRFPAATQPAPGGRSFAETDPHPGRSREL